MQKRNEENKDILVNFFHLSGPRTSFQLSKSDSVWVPVQKILRIITPLELSTTSGRTCNISYGLCNEISIIQYIEEILN